MHKSFTDLIHIITNSRIRVFQRINEHNILSGFNASDPVFTFFMHNKIITSLFLHAVAIHCVYLYVPPSPPIYASSLWWAFTFRSVKTKLKTKYYNDENNNHNVLLLLLWLGAGKLINTQSVKVCRATPSIPSYVMEHIRLLPSLVFEYNFFSINCTFNEIMNAVSAFTIYSSRVYVLCISMNGIIDVWRITMQQHLREIYLKILTKDGSKP